MSEDRSRGEPPREAVALRYDGSGAPRVIAKGRGELAERILEVADEHAVPLHPDRGLVELLSRIDLGDEIPPDLYVAVAQVLAFAYSLSGRELSQPGSPRPPPDPGTAGSGAPSRR